MKKRSVFVALVVSVLVLAVVFFALGKNPLSECNGGLCSSVKGGALKNTHKEVKRSDERQTRDLKPVKGKAKILLVQKNRSVYKTPGSKKVVGKIYSKTEWTKRTNRYLILDHKYKNNEEWIKVLLPIKPNGTAGWVKLLSSEEIKTTRRYIEISLKKRELSFNRSGNKTSSHSVVIGTPKTPTPKGLMAVQDIMANADPNEFTGSRIVVLTSFSETLETFQGAPPRIALHGRGGAALKDNLGTASSNGCIRLDNKEIETIARYLKPGDPVWIS